MRTAQRHNVTMSGSDGAQTIVFAHGFGCDQHMWRFVAPQFEDHHEVVLFDHIGAGGADPGSYDVDKYSSLGGYATDVIEICDDLDLSSVVFVGHSVSAMIGAMAAVRRPELFDKLVFVGPSARYINDDGYVGGFTHRDIDGLLSSMDNNYLGWSHAMAPSIMGNAGRPELGAELEESFCRADPDIARQFAEVTFRSDSRADLAHVKTPTLVLQCQDDIIAPVTAGEYVRDHLQNPTYMLLEATGHCPHLSAPEETVRAITSFICAP